MQNSRFICLLILCTSFFVACDKDDDITQPPLAEGEFLITVENVFQEKSYFAAGPTGFIEPGMSETYTFNAGKGHYLSFATMFVQSNDLFYAPAANGIVLYDENGIPTTGNITAMVDLWDAGTEVNEAPGVGDNQAPRQSGPNTGTIENGTVRLIDDVNDGYTYPADEEVIDVTLEHDGGTVFTLTIANISNNSSIPTPLAPGSWVVHFADQAPLFTEGEASSIGLEAMAEDGDNSTLDADLQNNSGLVSPFAPGAFATFTGEAPIFSSGTVSSDALEALAEDGDASGFSNVFNTPEGATNPGPIFPGQRYTFRVTAQEGDRLSFATMLVQSNDWFIGTSGIDLFSNGIALSGDITDRLRLYDSNTEVDEYPGAGINQAPRQSGPDTGTEESGPVELETGSFNNLPEVAEMIRVTISSNN